MLVVKVIGVFAGLLLLLAVVPQIMSIPGCRRFQRYATYENMQEMIVAETNDIRRIIPFQQDGSNYTAVLVKPCRVMASGPAALIYDHEGRLVDRNLDTGDAYRYTSGRRAGYWKFWPCQRTADPDKEN